MNSWIHRSNGLRFGLSLWAVAFAPGELLVKSTEIKDLSTLRERLHAVSIRPLASSKSWLRVRLARGVDPRQEAERLIQQGTVEWAEPNYRYSVESDQVSLMASGDPRLSELWSLERMRVREVWLQGYTGTAQTRVGVTDTGIDSGHLDLRANLFSHPGEVPGNGIDDDRNGYVDDVRGYDFEARSEIADDDFGHGTHVAGSIGAVGANGIGISGINQSVALMSLRWMKKGSGYASEATEAIRYAVRNGARVINASWGGVGYSKAMEEALKEARDQGVLFVASAGNRRADNDVAAWHPAAYQMENVVAVAALDPQDQLAKFSNYGATKVALAAPGTGILSTYPGGIYQVLEGTSMAAAQVSGVAALIFSIRPDLRAQTVKRLLIETSAPVEGLRGKVLSGGRVDAAAAVAAALALPKESDAFDEAELRGFESIKRFSALGGAVRVDEIRTQPTDAGSAKLSFVRVDENGIETPVTGLEFSTLVGGARRVLRTDDSGQVLISGCTGPLSATVDFEVRDRFRIADGGSTHSLSFRVDCGVESQLRFVGESSGAQVVSIWQVVQKALSRMSQSPGLSFWRYPVTIVWPGRGDFYSNDTVNLTRGDHWDVVGHELGHALYDQANIGMLGGGEHYIDQCYTPNLALSEGWASFYSAWLHLDLEDSDARFPYMVPRRAPIRVENVPSDVCRGETNEWRVTAFLWDLIDRHDDGESAAFLFSDLWKALSGKRARSASALRDLLLQQGFDPSVTRLAWSVSF